MNWYYELLGAIPSHPLAYPYHSSCLPLHVYLVLPCHYSTPALPLSYHHPTRIISLNLHFHLHNIHTPPFGCGRCAASPKTAQKLHTKTAHAQVIKQLGGTVGARQEYCQPINDT